MGECLCFCWNRYILMVKSKKNKVKCQYRELQDKSQRVWDFLKDEWIIITSKLVSVFTLDLCSGVQIYAVMFGKGTCIYGRQSFIQSTNIFI